MLTTSKCAAQHDYNVILPDVMGRVRRSRPRPRRRADRGSQQNVANQISADLTEMHENTQGEDLAEFMISYAQNAEDVLCTSSNELGHRIEQKNIVGAFGGDNLSLEAFPSEVEGNHIPVHTFLLAQHGIPIMELVELEGVPKDNVYEFAFIGGSLKLRGADAVPMRPIAIPMH